jgi:hypothetical protein
MARAELVLAVQCPICDCSFPADFNLELHANKCLDGGARPPTDAKEEAPCPLCGATFGSRPALEAHAAACGSGDPGAIPAHLAELIIGAGPLPALVRRLSRKKSVLEDHELRDSTPCPFCNERCGRQLSSLRATRRCRSPTSARAPCLGIPPRSS